LDVFAHNPAFSAEQFDREVVVIDIMRGLYFSLRGAAVDLWSSFQAPQTIDDATKRFEAVEATQRDQLKAAVEAMIAHELLLAQPGATASPLPPVRGPFEVPFVEVYTDLAELIAIDPVHEVDASEGWPVRPPGFPDAKA
jgi:hypothetical protein